MPDQERAGRARRRGGDRRGVDGGLVRASRGDPGLGGVPAERLPQEVPAPSGAREDEAVGPSTAHACRRAEDPRAGPRRSASSEPRPSPDLAPDGCLRRPTDAGTLE